MMKLDNEIENYIHKHQIEYYSAIKKIAILLFETIWIKLESFMLSEISHRDKDRNAR